MAKLTLEQRVARIEAYLKTGAPLEPVEELPEATPPVILDEPAE